jgi:folate-binding protein YgfZ
LHRRAGAEFAPAGAGQRPSHYGDPTAEYWAARRAAVVIDQSHRGRVRVAGRDRLDLIHRLTTNDILPLTPGRGLQNVFLTSKGRIVELFDCLVLDDHLLLCLTSPNAPAVVQWITQFVFIEEVTASDLSAETAELGIFGPAAAKALAAAGAAVSDLEARDHRSAEVAGVRVLVGGASPLAGSGFRLVCARGDAARVWETVIQAGAPLGLRPAGADVEEILRIEEALPAPGSELSERWNPLEAELRDAISFTKGCYTGQEVVARLNTYDKLQRVLRGLRVEDKLPPAGSRVLAGGAEAGHVTSAARSPALDAVIALAYIEREHSEPGTKLEIEIGPDGGALPADVLAPPFVPNGE